MVEDDNDQYRRKLEEWVAAHPGIPTGSDILQSGDFEILAGFVLRVVGAAGLASPIAWVDQRAVIDINETPPANPIMRIFAGLARAWSLSPSEKVGLLGVISYEDLETLNDLRIEQVPTAIAQRLIAILEIFKAINILLPVHSRADGWIRRENAGELFRGRTPLDVMTRDIEGLQSVQGYLQAEVSL
ncbi:antitoxin Xre/MbcA/ParS toxin-binding domain-containing protein [Sphingopyxis sp. USTB-05]|uniref:antitoxin Xre/MbcA/ParS toxin-binding domain-containing protein n=1 Tax=Sphingopyxis sp. USTB-05 TaxID=2830667 RepID=UPI00207892D5|nr:antitoxin Xre/MbcA/ParS toxin-binding domain-containing protein [Sphingopyxis sp. USTB-05]USI79073.1 DUF2384 domain-containing protein [Sphingopyxis sp. USTB-05]